jgi:hypothetical protein
MRKEIAYRSGSTFPVLGSSQSRKTPSAVNSPVRFIGGPIDCGTVVVVVVVVVVTGVAHVQVF